MSGLSSTARLWRACLFAVVLVTCIRVWTGPTDVIPVARAQIPDSGRQRRELLAEARQTNALLAEIREILKSHTIKVELQDSDKPKEVLPGSRRPPG
jgi:hypothetical protein